MYTDAWVRVLSSSFFFKLLLSARYLTRLHMWSSWSLLFFSYLYLSSSKEFLLGTYYVPNLSFIVLGAFFMFSELYVINYIHQCQCHLKIRWVSPWPWLILVSYGWSSLNLPWQGSWCKYLYTLMVSVPCSFLYIFSWRLSTPITCSVIPGPGFGFNFLRL